jgi:hypothetical protein
VPGCRSVGAWCVTNSFGGFSGNDLEFGEPYEGKEGDDSLTVDSVLFVGQAKRGTNILLQLQETYDCKMIIEV